MCILLLKIFCNGFKGCALFVLTHDIIYMLLDMVKDAMAELLDPELKENKVGMAEARVIYPFGKNAYVAGYRIAAKTGTSEKKDTKSDYTDTPYVCSAVAYAPYDAPKLTAMILVDEPTEGVLYASTIAAPYLANLMEAILPYYGVEREYSQEELENQTLKTPALVHGRTEFVKDFAESLGFKVEVVGTPPGGC